MPNTIAYASLPSPLGTLWIAAGPRGLLRITFAVDEAEFSFELERVFGAAPTYDPEALEPVITQLGEYFEGRRTEFDLPIDLSYLTGFQRVVLEAVREVPYGEVQSYGEIAQAVGKPGAARAVGGVMATNPFSIVIPCHRIVRSDGRHGEYAWRTMGASGASYKELLLGLESHHDEPGSHHAGR
ncbi:MAG TPA: methylated-DNA--[protein]-cysteine S-methyltransferase [Chloroflexota bacterium]